MKIEDILNITNGELVNEPRIQAVTTATAYSSKVELGDLFFAHNREDIPSAVKNGAYAIIFEGETPEIIDSEIAWILVKSIEESAFRLLRYIQLKKKASFYLFKPHEISFLKMILKYRNGIAILSNDWVKDFETILNSDSRLFIASDRKWVESVEPNFSKLEFEKDGYIINDTLFRTTFKVDGFIYQDSEMTPIHFEHLLQVVAFCQKEELEYSIEKLRYTKHFLPIFIDRRLNRLPSGKSDRVVIFSDNLEDITKAKKYIRRSNRWVKSIVLTPPKVKIDEVERCEWFESKDEAKEILKSRNYNYAFVYSLSKDILNSSDSNYSLL